MARWNSCLHCDTWSGMHPKELLDIIPIIKVSARRRWMGRGLGVGVDPVWLRHMRCWSRESLIWETTRITRVFDSALAIVWLHFLFRWVLYRALFYPGCHRSLPPINLTYRYVQLKDSLGTIMLSMIIWNLLI